MQSCANSSPRNPCKHGKIQGIKRFGGVGFAAQVLQEARCKGIYTMRLKTIRDLTGLLFPEPGATETSDETHLPTPEASVQPFRPERMANLRTKDGLTWVDLNQRPLGYEFPWACGPPMEMKTHFQGRLIPNGLRCDFRRSATINRI
jgi:hypothetical protein